MCDEAGAGGRGPKPSGDAHRGHLQPSASTAVAMTGLAAPWWGGQSPRATILPPRRLRAALHPLRHPLEPRCARLEPRPIPLTHAPAAASILLTYYLPARTTLPPCLWACACAYFAPLSGRIRDFTNSDDAGSAQPAANFAARHTCPHAYTHNMCSYDRNKARIGGRASWTSSGRRTGSRSTRSTADTAE